MSEPKSFKRLDFRIDKNARLINKVKPCMIRSTSVYIPLKDLLNYSPMENEKITLIDFANIHDIPMSDVNILLKNGINTIEELSSVGISYLKSLNLSNIQVILSALSK